MSKIWHQERARCLLEFERREGVSTVLARTLGVADLAAAPPVDWKKIRAMGEDMRNKVTSLGNLGRLDRRPLRFAMTGLFGSRAQTVTG